MNLTSNFTKLVLSGAFITTMLVPGVFAEDITPESVDKMNPQEVLQNLEELNLIRTFGGEQATLTNKTALKAYAEYQTLPGKDQINLGQYVDLSLQTLTGPDDDRFPEQILAADIALSIANCEDPFQEANDFLDNTDPTKFTYTIVASHMASLFDSKVIRDKAWDYMDKYEAPTLYVQPRPIQPGSPYL